MKNSNYSICYFCILISIGKAICTLTILERHRTVYTYRINICRNCSSNRMGIKKSSLDGRKNKIEIIFMMASIMKYIFILVRKSLFFHPKKKKNAYISVFFFKWSNKMLIRINTSICFTKKVISLFFEIFETKIKLIKLNAKKVLIRILKKYNSFVMILDH